MKLFEIFGTVSVDSRSAMTELSKVDQQAGKVSDTIGKTGYNIQELGKKAGRAGSVLTKGLTLPLVAAAGMSVKVGSTFQQSMANVQAVSGATGDEIKDLTDLARNLGKESIFSASEAADALSYMGMAGWKAEQMIDGLPGVMSLAAASGEDLALVSDIVTDSISAFGDEAEDASRYADVLATAATASNTTVGELGEAFKKAAPYAGALGFTMEDTSKYLGIMANSGTKASVAGTALRSTFANLASPTDAVRGAMDDLGVEIQNSDGSMKSLDEIMTELRGSFNGLDEAQKVHYANLIAGRTGGAGFVSIMNETEDAVNEFGDAIDNSNGKAEEMSDIMKDTLQGRFKEMQSAFEEVGHIVFEIVEPALKLILKVLTLLAEGFQAMPKPLQIVVVMFGTLAAVVGPILLIFSKFVALMSSISGGSAILATSVGLATKAAGLLKIAFALMTGPIGLAVAAIAAIVGIGYLLIKNWDKIKDASKAVWGFVSDNFGKIKDGIGNAMGTARDLASSATEKMSENVKNNLSNLREAADTFNEKFSESWGTLSEEISTKSSEMGASIKEFTGGIKDSWADLRADTKKKYEDIKEGILSPIRSARDKTKEIVQNIKDFFKFEIKFPEIKMPKITGEEGLLSKLTPKFTKSKPIQPKKRFFAKGGYMSNPTEFARDSRTSFIGGEAGGEGIVPLDGKHMHPLASEIAKLLREEQGGGHEVVNFNIDNLIGHATVREEADIRRIAEQLNTLTDRKNRQRGAY